jgi:hypothetical protein
LSTSIYGCYLFVDLFVVLLVGLQLEEDWFGFLLLGGDLRGGGWGGAIEGFLVGGCGDFVAVFVYGLGEIEC